MTDRIKELEDNVLVLHHHLHILNNYRKHRYSEDNAYCVQVDKALTDTSPEAERIRAEIERKAKVEALREAEAAAPSDATEKYCRERADELERSGT